VLGEERRLASIFENPNIQALQQKNVRKFLVPHLFWRITSVLEKLGVNTMYSFAPKVTAEMFSIIKECLILSKSSLFE